MDMIEIVTNVIRERKSTYANNFIKKKVAKEVLEEILINGLWAPTHKMTEPWHFIILAEEEIDKFGKYMSIFYKDMYPEEYLSFSSYPKNAAYIIVIMMERNKHKNIPEWEEIAAVSCAVQNIWLSCESYKLAAYWDTSEVSISYGSTLKINENQQCLGFLYLGHPDPSKTRGKRRRKSLDKKTTWLKA